MVIRRYWRLFRLFLTTLTYTTYVSVAVRFQPEDEQPFFRARHQMIGCQKLARILNLKVNVVGDMPEGGALLAVSNHIGMLDSLILASQMPIAFVGKAEIKGWTFIGWVTTVYGLIFVDRRRRTQTTAFVDEVRSRLRHGVRVLVFPEGTTNRKWELLPFKTGTFEAVANMPDGAALPLYMFIREVDGQPASDALRDHVVWADDTQTFGEHAWSLLERDNVIVDLYVGEPWTTHEHDRKELAQHMQAEVESLRDQALASHQLGSVA